MSSKKLSRHYRKLSRDWRKRALQFSKEAAGHRGCDPVNEGVALRNLAVAESKSVEYALLAEEAA